MFSNAIRVFSVSGFAVKLDPSWLLIAALITWSLATRFFPETQPDLTSGAYLVMAILAMLGFFGSLLLHELAHSVVARRHGVRITGITLFVFGGVAELESEPDTAGAEFRIAIAGPAMSFALAAGFWCLGLIGRILGFASPISEVVAYLALINLVLGLFNLVPAFPLDGGRVLRAYLWDRTGDMLRATRIAARSGTIFGLAVIIMGLVLLLGGQSMAGLWQVFIGGFLLLAARSSYQQQLMKSGFEGKSIATLMTSAPITVAPGVTLSELVNQTMLRHHASFVPVVEEGRLLGYIDTSVLNRIDRDNWANTTVGDVFIAAHPDNTIPADLSARDLMTRITNSGRRKFLVADGPDLLGVVTLADLLEYLSIVQEIRAPQPGQAVNTPP